MTEQKLRKAVFRIPAITYLAIVFLMVCLIPVSFNGVPGLWALYIVPLGLIVFVARTRTIATPQGLDTRTMFGHREIPWDALKGLAITPRSKVRAVLADDSQLPLPTVRTRHIPVMSLVSDGRVADPTGLTDDLTGKSPAEATGDKPEENPA
ncbi:MAG TPA: PH domain-containing protein [Amycolatopsis sp.]|nr:PH domain-containing protein [Amycolatopsis sp.]